MTVVYVILREMASPSWVVQLGISWFFIGYNPFMPTDILTTKFLVPPLRKELVNRPHLIKQLSEGLDRKLTLVSGPAGFGKTTLLSSWLAACDRPGSWLSLDESDNDWARFLTILIEAMQKISAGIGIEIIDFLHSSFPLESDGLLTYLVNQAAEVPTPYTLVFDDYHVIINERIHQLLQFILENQPPQMNLVISTRSDPPWPLARWRVRGEILEIRTSDLRFNPQETKIFLNDIMGFDFSEVDLRRLDNRVEGWAAGLQMAALSMKGRGDLSTFIDNFTGSHRFVFDYLIEEVFQRLSPQLQLFLLETSILDRFCAPLCDYVRDAKDSQLILNQLDQMNLFIIQLDDHRNWYRYHPLFNELIQQISRQRIPDQLKQLHRRAREWYQGNDSVRESIRHGIAEENFEAVADLIEGNFLNVQGQKDRLNLTHWLQELPAHLFQTRPWLNVAYAYMLFLSGRDEDVPRLLQESGKSAEKYGPVENEHLHSYIAFIQAKMAEDTGDIPATIEYSRQSLSLLPPQDTRMRCSIASTLGTALQRSGEFEGAAQAYADGISAGRTIGDSTAVITLYGDLVGLFVEQGKLYQAYEYCQDALQFIESNFQRRGRTTPAASHIHFRLSTIFRHWNDLGGSLKHAQISTDILKKWGRQNRLSTVNLAIATHAVGDYPKAHRILKEAERYARHLSPYWLENVIVRKVVFWLVEGNLDAAVGWVMDQNLDSHHELDYEKHLIYLTMSRVRLVQGQHGDQDALYEAIDLLEKLEEMYIASGAIAYLLQTYILQALAFQSVGELDLAVKSIKKAITLGEVGGYIRVFVREGEPMAELVHRFILTGGRTPYIEKILAAFEHRGKEVEQPIPATLLEPLTARELEVLRALDSELKVPELAEAMIVSIDTLRTHIKRIYRKLDVHSRFEAVEKGKKLNLV